MVWERTSWSIYKLINVIQFIPLMRMYTFTGTTHEEHLLKNRHNWLQQHTFHTVSKVTAAQLNSLFTSHAFLTSRHSNTSEYHYHWVQPQYHSLWQGVRYKNPVKGLYTLNCSLPLPILTTASFGIHFTGMTTVSIKTFTLMNHTFNTNDSKNTSCGIDKNN